jgi:hypothetical protein
MDNKEFLEFAQTVPRRTWGIRDVRISQERGDALRPDPLHWMGIGLAFIAIGALMFVIITIAVLA